jgi:hypothetical protein
MASPSSIRYSCCIASSISRTLSAYSSGKFDDQQIGHGSTLPKLQLTSLVSPPIRVGAPTALTFDLQRLRVEIHDLNPATR